MKKFPLFAGLVLTAALAAAPLFAVPEGSPAPAAEEKTQPGPVAVTVSPATQVNDFFARLAEGRIDVAYDQLIKGSIIDHNPKAVADLKTKTREAIKVFGAIGGYETIDSKLAGNHLQRMTCLSLGKKFPIRWRFYFYQTDSAWVLLDIRVNDRLAEYFDEPAPDVPAPAPAK